MKMFSDGSKRKTGFAKNALQKSNTNCHFWVTTSERDIQHGNIFHKGDCPQLLHRIGFFEKDGMSKHENHQHVEN